MIIENCRRLRAPQRWGECFPPPRNLKATGRVELGHLGQGKQKPAPVPSSTWPRGVARPGDPKMTATDANSCRARPVVGCARQLVVFRRSTDQRATPPRRPHRAAATRPLRLTARPRPTRARPPSTASRGFVPAVQSSPRSFSVADISRVRRQTTGSGPSQPTGLPSARAPGTPYRPAR